jgi:NAD(P)-dependent dehydrogenase (short-subunit alcohol dehydrogenase family)
MMNEAEADKAFAAAYLDVGPPNMLIATIGGVRPWKQVKEMPADEFRYLFELNLMSFFVASKLAMKLMSAGGTIISIGAESALQPPANKAGYVAAKAGVVAFTRVLAEEGKWIGINANCIVPTVIRTASNEQWGDPNDIAKWTEPKDIAAMCLFLSSDAGKAVNGATIRMTNRL